ncbi:hypothetical protein [Streptomyces nitrosporeus]|uniref:hypothetical protein n=1 Tax=Streptomyces nitrosporeus TaxID=28894 RepID=UPI0039A3D6CB
MPTTSTPPPRSDATPRPRRNFNPWSRHQRRATTGHFIRGLSYGTGATLASIAGYWLQQL